MSVIDNSPWDGRSIRKRLDDKEIRSSTWLNKNHPENGVFRVYWKNVYDETVPDGGATLDPNEGEGLRYEWYYKDGKRANGKSRGWWPNGQIKQVRTYKNGKHHGPWTEWHINGQKKKVVMFNNKLRDGLWTEWWANGQKRLEGTYKKNKKVGVWTVWYENGTKKKEEIYDENGEMTEKIV